VALALEVSDEKLFANGHATREDNPGVFPVGPDPELQQERHRPDDQPELVAFDQTALETTTDRPGQPVRHRVLLRPDLRGRPGFLGRPGLLTPDLDQCRAGPAIATPKPKGGKGDQ
jgi:hypothetical protein